MRDSFVFPGTTQSACTESAFGRHKTLTTRRKLNDAFVSFLYALQVYAGPSPFRRGKDGIPGDQCDKGRFHSGGGFFSLACAWNRRQCMSALRSAECATRPQPVDGRTDCAVPVPAPMAPLQYVVLCITKAFVLQPHALENSFWRQYINELPVPVHQ
jgi:hypothetical protein